MEKAKGSSDDAIDTLKKKRVGETTGWRKKMRERIWREREREVEREGALHLRGLPGIQVRTSTHVHRDPDLLWLHHVLLPKGPLSTQPHCCLHPVAGGGEENSEHEFQLALWPTVYPQTGVFCSLGLSFHLYNEEWNSTIFSDPLGVSNSMNQWIFKNSPFILKTYRKIKRVLITINTCIPFTWLYQ